MKIRASFDDKKFLILFAKSIGAKTGMKLPAWI